MKIGVFVHNRIVVDLSLDPNKFIGVASHNLVWILQTKEHKLISSPELQKDQNIEMQKTYKILLAFSGLKHALTNNPGYNRRVSECQEAARILLKYAQSLYI